MDKSEKLKSAILSEYKSIREFSKVVDIPNSTIVSALEKGIGGMAVDKMIKICDVLNLDIKTLDKKEVETIAASKKNEIIDWTDEDLQDIEDFKKYVLSKRDKKDN
ncbi:MAG TPA: hypothetical protein DC000_00095 [Clostridiales bacterium]|nr:hypothetical protein [Clostridiales bacterium]